VTSPREDELTRLALDAGATHAAVLATEDVRLYREVRRLCEQNACGRYGRNWQCPPHVGPLEETAARFRAFSHGLLVQTVGDLEDSYDVEGMGRIQTEHQRRVRRIAASIHDDPAIDTTLALGAGPCDVCETGSILEEAPCPIPDRAMPSVEAFGMNVKEVVESCGLQYMGGANTVSYVGLILYSTLKSSP